MVAISDPFRVGPDRVCTKCRAQFRHLLADSVLALVLVVGHAIIIMCQVQSL